MWWRSTVFSISFYYFMLLFLLAVICSRKQMKSDAMHVECDWSWQKLTTELFVIFSILGMESGKRNGEASGENRLGELWCVLRRNACTKNRFVSIFLSRFCHDGAVREMKHRIMYVELIFGAYACHCQRHDVAKGKKELLHPLNGRETAFLFGVHIQVVTTQLHTIGDT